MRPSLDPFHKQVFDREEADGVTVSVFFLVLVKDRLRILLLIVND